MKKIIDLWRNVRFQTSIDIGLLSILVILFFMTLSILVLNIDRAFDITDEGFNLLSASQPENIIGQVTQYGYYTSYLYKLSGENVAIFRLLGIVILLLIAGAFSYSLECYWQKITGSTGNTTKSFIVLFVILIAVLAYYKDWRWLTPSYNWLVLVSTLIVATGLLLEAKGSYNKNITGNITRSLIINAVLIGLGMGMAFLTKPTSPVILSFIILFWLILHPKQRNRILFIGMAMTMSVLVILTHAYVFKGGVISFIIYMQDGLELSSAMYGENKIVKVVSSTAENLNWLVANIFTFPAYVFICLFFLIFLLIFLNRKGFAQISIAIFTICLSVLVIDFWHVLYVDDIWTRAWIGFGGLKISSLLMLFSFCGWLIWRNGNNIANNTLFLRLIVLNVFLLSLSFAFAFGTNNDIWIQLSAGYIFIATASFYSARWIDKLTGSNLISYVLSILIALSVLTLVNSQYENPRRQVDGIGNQKIRVSFLSSGGQLKVDRVTAKYINKLKSVALEAGWQPGMPLIDMTGGTPGATYILGGRVMGKAWLIGGYPGSEGFVKTVLAKLPESLLQSAWVLHAPEGRRSIPDNVLSDLGLDFPNGYKALGEMRTGHRNELQILWRPVNDNEIH